MYKQTNATRTTLRVQKWYSGESIEQKVNRIVNNKEPIKDGAPLIYTARKDGVKAEMNVRTDRFELANNAMDIVTKDKLAKREQRQASRDENSMGQEAKEGMKKEGETPEPNTN